MNRIFETILLLLLPLTLITAAESFVAFEQGEGLFPLVSDNAGATLFISNNEDEGVEMAVEALQKDILSVTGVKPSITHKQQKGCVVIGTISQPQIRKALIKAGVDLSELEGKREKYILTTYEDQLLIAGSDKRGAIYGVYELSRQIGVSPWYWFMDVPVQKHAQLFIRSGVFTDGEPAVAYRGIFINDEWPSFGMWCMSHFGGVNSAMYQHIFELLLRLKGNFFWPAMWDSAFFDDDPNNGVLANKMGIVMSTSHHEPMNLAQQDWKRRGGTEAKWNYLTNAEGLRAFWRTGIERAKDWETITIVGMRGDGDMEMPSAEDNQALLEQIVADQRQIIEDVTHRPASETPQVWALYKEVQDYYDNGMQVPEDITLMLCDDNWGNVRRVPSPENINRKGGFGLYYHFDYVGIPRNSKWINISPIPRVWEQLNLAYEHGIRQIWITNVGDLKPMEYPIQFFMDMAWNPYRFNATNLTQHTDSFCASIFGEEFAQEASRLLRTYAKFNRRVTPELLDAHTYSFAYNEWDRVVADYNRLREDARKLEKQLPDSLQSAYFELLGMPIEGVSNLYNMYYAQANGWIERVKECYDYDSLLTIRYHQLENGKWNHMMDEKRIGYTYWQTPDFRIMPKVDSVSSTPLNQQIFPIATHPYPLQSTKHQTPNTIAHQVNGYVAFEAEHFARKHDGTAVSWTVIPELGRTLSGLTTQPITAAVDGAWVEYDFTTTEGDSAHVIVRLAPTLNYIPEGQRLAIRLDGKEQLININGHYRGELGQWQQDHIIDIEANFACPAGQHTLRLTPLDNGIVMEKIMIDLGGLQPSFLGPEETFSITPKTTWCCAPQWLYNIPPLAHRCLTQRVHVSVGGEGLALTLTNRFGESVLSFDSVFVEQKPMLFNGQKAVAIAAGEDLMSDWMPYQVQALDTLTITLYYNEVPTTLTGHSGSRTTSYISSSLGEKGDSFVQWVSILNLQTSNPDAHIWAALGNSITDGRGSTTDKQNRWTDVASAITLNHSTTNIGFLNLGIGGNFVTGGGLGPTAAKRFENDILQQVGVEGVILFIGVNDIGNTSDIETTLDSLKTHFRRFISLSHNHGLSVLVCTVTPFEGNSYFTPEHEQLRQRFNEWLRSEALVEGVIDLDKVLSDPMHPSAVPAALQDNDGLHPSALGHCKIGETIAAYFQDYYE